MMPGGPQDLVNARNAPWTQSESKREHTAVVIGAGIAGLTAAHELAERRFKVWVVEPVQDVNRFGVETMAIGGMARTQYVAGPTSAAAAAKMQKTDRLIPFRLLTVLDKDFDPNAEPPLSGIQQRHVRYLEYLCKEARITVLGRPSNAPGVPEEGFPNLRAAIRRKTGIRPRDIRWEGTAVPGPDEIILVRRSRTAWVSFSSSYGLTPEGRYRIGTFVENLATGAKVQITYAPIPQERSIAARELTDLLRRYSVTTEEGTQEGEEDAEEGEEDAEEGEEGAQEGEELGKIKLTTPHAASKSLKLTRSETLERKNDDLAPESIVDFEKFVGIDCGGVGECGLVSGDIVEIHVGKGIEDSAAVHRIRRVLRERAVISILRILIRKNKNNKPIWAYPEWLLMPSTATQETRQALAGEHGFRFFPAYYRHLRNTLERIPVYETGWGHNPVLVDKLSGRTVIDNLVNTPAQALAGGSTNPMVYPRKPSPSPIAVFLQIKDLLLERGYDVRDVQQFVLRLMRYMATGTKRREAELEGLSWWDYLRGFDPMTGTYRYRYSQEFAKDVLESPRVLAAFDAQWGDARTNGSTFVQLLLNQFLEHKDVDQLLNAPTTEAWFEHWELYLREYLDVTFVPASVDMLIGYTSKGAMRVKPMLTPVTSGNPTDDQALKGLVELIESKIENKKVDYFVLATDAPTAERLTAIVDDLYQPLQNFRIGAAQELEGFVTIVRAAPDGSQPALNRMSLKQPLRYGDAPWDRFQTLTGIQFYFVNVTGIFDGHVYFMGAPWALSSINQHQFWRFSPVVRGAPFQSVLSADIGQFNEAWNLNPPPSSSSQIADEVWKQVVNALRDYWNLHRKDPIIDALETKKVGPEWYHLDNNIVIDGPDGSKAAPELKNLAPYLIPIVCDWQNRPRDTIWDPGESMSAEPLPAATADLWHARWGGYRVHWGQWVFAGTYLRHFTRMTTMEAANESARHAVNAILDHATDAIYRGLGIRGIPNDQARSLRRRYHTAGNPLDARAAYIPTPLGDYCHIWDPEKYELADFVPLRELDDWLFEQGLPHAWDLMGQEVFPALISQLPSAHEMGLPSVNDILRALTPPFTPPPGSGFPPGWNL